MTSAEIRQSFLDFFREKQHTIVPSASLLPDSPNLLFTNAGMNQFVPIFLGQQKPAWNPPRVADTQKCIRAGGKHNDLDDVGLDTYHHTFFEMLGNWSFGDYFKKEAIDWAWELVVDRWKLPASRVYATVYQPGPGEPSEFDQEAHDHWARLFEKAGLDPAVHIVNGNKKDNFWMMGDTGPCGPCSELHIDLTPAGDTKGSLVNAGDPRCIEIWNLVFIQFNADADGTFSPLPQRHVDTGMGFERITAMIQGTKDFSDFSRPISNYETDIFHPIFDEIERLSGKKYGNTLPPPPGSAAVSAAGEGVSPSRTLVQAPSGATTAEESSSRRDAATSDRDGRATQIAIDIAFRVIADHIRTLSFAIADGIQPSNEGRGYVLRRILRRAVRYGRTLGFHEPFFYKLVDVLSCLMDDVFPEIREKQLQIKHVLNREEDAFNKTLDTGIQLLNGYMDSVSRAEKKLSKDYSVVEMGRDPFMQAMKEIRFFLLSDAWARHAIISALEPHLYASGAHTAENLINDAERLTGILVPILVGTDSDELVIRRSIHKRIKMISGRVAFQLYDTYGFPLDLTELMARERGLTVDVAGFEKLMEEQRERARKAQKREVISVADDNLQLEPTKFLGYDFLETEALVEAVTPGKNEDEVNVMLDRTACYAEMGGQVGDHGLLHVPGYDRTEAGRLTVLDTQKHGDVFIHRAKLAEGRAPEVGEAVRISVDSARRGRIQGHHTVTHLLHWALHEKVNKEATQKGSYVGPETDVRFLERGADRAAET